MKLATDIHLHTYYTDWPDGRAVNEKVKKRKRTVTTTLLVETCI